MKPFDLQKALAGEPVITRAGEKVEKIFHNPDALEFHRVVFWVNGVLRQCSESGSLGSGQHGHDLFMAPNEVDVWINIYTPEGLDRSGQYLITDGKLYANEPIALQSALVQSGKILIATKLIKITL